MLRKHMNSIPSENVLAGIVPFYSWQCLTLQMANKDVDLIIQDEKDIDKLLYLLICMMKPVEDKISFLNEADKKKAY